MRNLVFVSVLAAGTALALNVPTDAAGLLGGLGHAAGGLLGGSVSAGATAKTALASGGAGATANGSGLSADASLAGNGGLDSGVRGLAGNVLGTDTSLGGTLFGNGGNIASASGSAATTGIDAGSTLLNDADATAALDAGTAAAPSRHHPLLAHLRHYLGRLGTDADTSADDTLVTGDSLLGAAGSVVGQSDVPADLGQTLGDATGNSSLADDLLVDELSRSN